jgi:hypothetical protein
VKLADKDSLFLGGIISGINKSKRRIKLLEKFKYFVARDYLGGLGVNGRPN